MIFSMTSFSESEVLDDMSCKLKLDDEDRDGAQVDGAMDAELSSSHRSDRILDAAIIIELTDKPSA